MFFDENRQDDLYFQTLLSIAQTQRKLLDQRFNWYERKSIPKKKSGIWSRRNIDTEYDGLLEKLEELKQQAQSQRTKIGHKNGVFWWNLPWTQIEDYLIYDLIQDDSVGSWRFERSWKTQRTNRGTQLLLLHEEGHFSNFSKSTSYDTGIISSYSASEINDKMRDFNHMMNKYDLATLALTENTSVKSVLSGIEYDSGVDYLLSSEHYLMRDHYKNQYARSLYTETETTTVTVSSSSQHYEAVFAVAEFTLNHCSLQNLIIHNYELCGSRGDLPSEIQNLYSNKDAAVSSAAYLSDLAEIKSVPIELFGGGLKNGASDFQDAVRQAEIYTCLANKFTI